MDSMRRLFWSTMLFIVVIMVGMQFLQGWNGRAILRTIGGCFVILMLGWFMTGVILKDRDSDSGP